MVLTATATPDLINLLLSSLSNPVLEVATVNKPNVFLQAVELSKLPKNAREGQDALPCKQRKCILSFASRCLLSTVKLAQERFEFHKFRLRKEVLTVAVLLLPSVSLSCMAMILLHKCTIKKQWEVISLSACQVVILPLFQYYKGNPNVWRAKVNLPFRLEWTLDLLEQPLFITVIIKW